MIWQWHSVPSTTKTLPEDIVGIREDASKNMLGLTQLLCRGFWEDVVCTCSKGLSFQYFSSFSYISSYKLCVVLRNNISKKRFKPKTFKLKLRMTCFNYSNFISIYIISLKQYVFCSRLCGLHYWSNRWMMTKLICLFQDLIMMRNSKA